MFKVKRTIKYDADRVKGFGREIMGVSGCDQLPSCIQCGTCSGACPLSIYMDFSPRQVMALVRADFKNEVLRSQTVWLCASCYGCTVECPRQIRITDIMYALKQRAIKEGVYPRHMPIPILAREFTKMVISKGRITETLLVMQLFMRANWRAVLSSWRLGIGLIRTGRFVLKPERIERRGELATMLATVNGNSSLNIGKRPGLSDRSWAGEGDNKGN
jgi:quinone-modifying oxidoreductase, subunit QmoC